MPATRGRSSSLRTDTRGPTGPPRRWSSWPSSNPVAVIGGDGDDERSGHTVFVGAVTFAARCSVAPRDRTRHGVCCPSDVGDDRVELHSRSDRHSCSHGRRHDSNVGATSRIVIDRDSETSTVPSDTVRVAGSDRRGSRLMRVNVRAARSATYTFPSHDRLPVSMSTFEPNTTRRPGAVHREVRVEVAGRNPDPRQVDLQRASSFVG